MWVPERRELQAERKGSAKETRMSIWTTFKKKQEASMTGGR